MDTQLARPHRFHIEGRRWFQRSFGNTYHTVRIYDADGTMLTKVGPCYGYGDQYLQTALDWLRAEGLVTAGDTYGTVYLRESVGATWTVADVGRKGDL